jgi:hypothetical protein
VWIWQLADGSNHQVLDISCAVQSVAFASLRQVVAGTAMGIVVLRIGSADAGASER